MTILTPAARTGSFGTVKQAQRPPGYLPLLRLDGKHRQGSRDGRGARLPA